MFVRFFKPKQMNSVNQLIHQKIASGFTSSHSREKTSHHLMRVKQTLFQMKKDRKLTDQEFNLLNETVAKAIIAHRLLITY
jgi:hypothetical protein